MAQLAEQVIECFNTAAAVIEASKLDPEEAREFRQLWANVYSSACDVLGKIGDIYPELDPFSPQRLHEHIQDMKGRKDD